MKNPSRNISEDFRKRLHQKNILKSSLFSARIEGNPLASEDLPSLEVELNNINNPNLPPRQEEIYFIIKEHRLVSFDFIKRRFLKIPSRTLRYDLKKLAENKYIT